MFSFAVFKGERHSVLCAYNPGTPEAERQEDYGLEAILGYIKSQVNPMEWDLVSKIRVKTKQKTQECGLWVVQQ